MSIYIMQVNEDNNTVTTLKKLTLIVI